MQDASDSDFTFVDGVIKKYHSRCQVRIPEEIEGKPVKCVETTFTGGENSWSGVFSIFIPCSVESIGNECFKECRSLTSIEFSSDIHLKSIGESTFAYSGLRSIHLPSSLESIGDYCFCDCKSLTSVEFASDIHLKSIGVSAFAKSGLTSIHLPSSLENIGGGCFSDCDVNLTIDGDNVHFRAVDGLLMSFDYKNIVCIYRRLSTIHLPSSLESIGDNCFYECTSLTSVEFSSDIHLKSIGHSAFEGSGVTSIHLPSSLESIGVGCFALCRSLTSVEFASDIHLKSIGLGAFDDCRNLTMVKIPWNFGFKDEFPKSVRFEVISS